MIVGNSSAGIREAPVYGVPTVDVGSRQHRRFAYPSIVHSAPDAPGMAAAIAQAAAMTAPPRSDYFGRGDSASQFLLALKSPSLWQVATQKTFFGGVAAAPAG